MPAALRDVFQPAHVSDGGFGGIMADEYKEPRKRTDDDAPSLIQRAYSVPSSA